MYDDVQEGPDAGAEAEDEDGPGKVLQKRGRESRRGHLIGAVPTIPRQCRIIEGELLQLLVGRIKEGTASLHEGLPPAMQFHGFLECDLSLVDALDERLEPEVLRPVAHDAHAVPLRRRLPLRPVGRQARLLVLRRPAPRPLHAGGRPLPRL